MSMGDAESNGRKEYPKLLVLLAHLGMGCTSHLPYLRDNVGELHSERGGSCNENERDKGVYSTAD